MARDKAKDDKYFNCNEQHEHDYVIGLYDDECQEEVRILLRTSCLAGVIKNFTHQEVYEFIEKHLGLPVPV